MKQNKHHSKMLVWRLRHLIINRGYHSILREIDFKHKGAPQAINILKRAAFGLEEMLIVQSGMELLSDLMGPMFGEIGKGKRSIKEIRKHKKTKQPRQRKPHHNQPR